MSFLLMIQRSLRCLLMRGLSMSFQRMKSLSRRIPRMMIQNTSCTSILACRQEHISHWPLSCTEECGRWSIAGGEYCDTAGTPAALEHGGSFVPGQHCTAVLEHSGTAAW